MKLNPKPIPIEEFIKQYAQTAVYNLLDGGSGRIIDLYWPALIYGINSDALYHEVKLKYEALLKEHNDQFRETNETQSK